MAGEKQRKRSKFETIYAFLRLCTKKTKKTHIMYRVNLSHQQLEKYLGYLVENKLIVVQDGEYLTTERGRSFMEKFRELYNIAEGEQLRDSHDSGFVRNQGDGILLTSIR